MKIPEHYLPVMPYLILPDGNAFLSFTQHVFGAVEHFSSRDQAGHIRHGEIKIGDALVMFGQSSDQWAVKPCGMFLYVPDVDETYDRAMRHDAISLHVPVQQDYGYTAGFEDPFGNQWWIVQGES